MADTSPRRNWRVGRRELAASYDAASFRSVQVEMTGISRRRRGAVSDTGTQSSIPSTFFNASALTFFVAMAKPDDAPPMTGTLNELSDIWLNNTTSGLGNSNERTASAPAFLNARICVVRLVASVAA